MCIPGLDPVTLAIISSAASAGGSYLNARAEVNDQNARLAARQRESERELTRQRRFQEEAGMNLGNTLDAVAGDPMERVDANAAQREAAVDADREAYSAENFGYSPEGGANNGAPRVVQESRAKALGDALEFGDQQSRSVARLRGYGDAAGQRGTALQENGSMLGDLTSMATRSAGVNQIEQQSAMNNVKPSSRLLGDLLGVAGTIGSLASMTGGLGNLLGNGGAQVVKGGASAPMFNLRGLPPVPGGGQYPTFSFRSGVG